MSDGMSDWNGWQRLWLVFTLMFGLPLAWFAWADSERASFDVPLTAIEAALPKAERDHLFWRKALHEPAGRNCIEETMEADGKDYRGGFYVKCSNEWKYRFKQALFLGGMPGLILYIIGFAVAWVRRGFRQAKTA